MGLSFGKRGRWDRQLACTDLLAKPIMVRVVAQTSAREWEVAG